MLLYESIPNHFGDDSYNNSFSFELNHLVRQITEYTNYQIEQYGIFLLLLVLFLIA